MAAFQVSGGDSSINVKGAMPGSRCALMLKDGCICSHHLRMNKSAPMQVDMEEVQLAPVSIPGLRQQQLGSPPAPARAAHGADRLPCSRHRLAG